MAHRPSQQALFRALSAGLLLGLSGASTGVATQDAPPQSPDEVVLVGAGDIAKCEILGGAVSTARLLDQIPGTVFTAGDNAYDTGSAEDFAKCYNPTWGRHKARTRPAPGNHDWRADGGRSYFAYFGENAGPSGLGYYSYDLGAWHIISLNSIVDAGEKSAQGRWLKADLDAAAGDCILAYWHAPLFSSGPHGSERSVRDLWRLLYGAGAEIIVNGHDHDYERFAPQNPDGKAEPERGIREFVVGTGGGGVYRFKRTAPNSEIRDNSAYGVLKLTLSPGRYAWEFIPATAGGFSDAGTGTCSPKPQTPQE